MAAKEEVRVRRFERPDWVPWEALELGEEAHVASHEHAQVGQVVAKGGNALGADAEGESRVLLVVDATVVEHVGVNHAAAHDFEPAGMFAYVASFASVVTLSLNLNIDCLAITRSSFLSI